MRLRLSTSGKRLSRKSSKSIRRMKKTLRLLKSRKSTKSQKKSHKSHGKMNGGFNGTFLGEVYLGRPSIGFGPVEASPQAGGARKPKRTNKNKYKKGKKSTSTSTKRTTKRGGDRLAATQHMIPHVGTIPWEQGTPAPVYGGKYIKKSKKSKKQRKVSNKKRGGDRMSATQHWASSALQPQ